ncbi:MAG: OmpH family outer membrane protein [Bacteroidaceae bacterium]|nr:OmpH family outer membrane protein [Bacteroidaceae bacterium]
MRKQIVLSLFFAFVSLSLSAQQGYFGYISFNKTVQLMPEYMEAQLKLEQLRADYKNEVERSKREFDRQYTDFMINQDQLSSTIVAKRQKELQLLMDSNVEFRNIANKALEEQRLLLLDPLKQKVLEAVAEVCKEKQLDYVVDTDQRTYLYINTERGSDISHDVYLKLGITVQIDDSMEEVKSDIVK